MTDRKTTVEYWDAVWARQPRARVPSRLNIDVRNTTDLLRRHVRRGDRFLEIGCAPGKFLLWVAEVLGAKVTGLDYASTGVKQAQELFGKVGASAELLCEDIFQTSLADGAFDVVFSNGLIEHFDDPAPLVQRHFDLVRPGGVAIILIPNYLNVYGRIQAWLDPANLAIHNLNIMRLDALRSIAPRQQVQSARAYHWGRMSPWTLSLQRKLPMLVASTVAYGFNSLAHLQPMCVESLSPTLVLELHKAITDPAARSDQRDS